ncbi:MAG: AsmA family protein [Hahellaceae bacterium]|nr:AsmA family protein [Hahellaceae bacterium]
MNRTLKILIGLVLFILILLGGLVVALPSLVNDFKPEIERVVQEQTGMTLSLKGDIGISLFPILGVEIGEVNLSLPEGDPFAAVDSLRIAVAIIPLMSGQLQVDKVMLEGARLDARKDAKGRGNWEIIAETQAKRKSGAESADASKAEDSANADGETAKTTASPLPDLDIALIRVANTEVNYQDESTGQAVKLQLEDMALESLRWDEYFPVSLRYQLDNQKPAVALKHTLETELKISRDLKQFALRDLNTALDVTGEPTHQKTVHVTLAGNAEADLNRQKISIPAMTLGLDDTRIKTTLDYDLASQQLNASLAGTTLDVNAYLPPAALADAATDTKAQKVKAAKTASAASGTAAGPSGERHPFKPLKTLNVAITLTFEKVLLPGHVIENVDLALTGKDGILSLSKSNLVMDGEKLAATLKIDARQAEKDRLGIEAGFKGLKLDTTLKTNLLANLSQEKVQLDDLAVTVNKVHVSGNPGVKNFQAPQVFGALKVAEFSPREVMTTFGVEPPVTANPQALTKVSFATQLSGEPNLLALDDIQILLDKTRFSGKASFDLKSQALKGSLAGDSIVLDDYLPPPSPESKEAGLPVPVPPSESAGGKDSRDPNAPLLPLETLRGLNADLRFTLKQLVFREYQTENMEIALTAKDGLIQLTKANAALYDGTLVTKATVDARTDQPTYAFNTKLANVNADKFPKSLSRQEFLFGLLKVQPQGKINLGADYQSQGNTLSSVVDNAKANMDLYLEKGAIEELKTLTKLYQLAAQFNEKVTDPSNLVASTPFKDLKTDFTLEGSKLKQNQYSLQLNKDADVQGSGSVDLLKRTLKYDFRLKPTEAFVQKDNKWATALVDIPLNYTCTADLNQSKIPSCGVDNSSIEKAVKAHAEQKLKAKASEKLDTLLEKKLNTDSAKPEEEKTDKEKQRDALKDAGKNLLKGLLN